MIALELLRRFWHVPVVVALVVTGIYMQKARDRRHFEAGAASVQSKWDAEKQDARVALAVRIGFADATGKRTAEQAATITQETRAETTAALGRIEDAIAGFEADLRKRGCPVDVPPGVRDEGRKAVAAARAAGNEVRSDNAAR